MWNQKNTEQNLNEKNYRKQNEQNKILEKKGKKSYKLEQKQKP